MIMKKKLIFLPILAMLFSSCGSEATPTSGGDPVPPEPQDIKPTSIVCKENKYVFEINQTYNLEDAIDYEVKPEDTTNKDVTWSTESNDSFSITGNILTTTDVEGTGLITITSVMDTSIYTSFDVEVIDNTPPVIEKYIVTYNESDDYTVSGLLEEYKEGDEVEFTLTLINENKLIDKVKVDEVYMEPDAGTYSFIMPNHDVEIVITLKDKPVEDLSRLYNIEYDMSGRSTSYTFKDGENNLILETFVTDKENIINSISDFHKVYGGGYGGSGDTKWVSGDLLKIGSTSETGYLTFDLAKEVNKIKITGFASNNALKVQAGEPSSMNEVVATNMTIANKDNVESGTMGDIEIEFESTKSLKIANGNKYVLYIASIEFFFGIEKTYTVTWLDDEQNVLEVDYDVLEGSTPSFDGDIPEKEGYYFVDWSPSIGPIYSDTTYKATYAELGETFTVTWVNYDDEVLQEDKNVIPGTVPTYKGNVPTRSDEEYIYIFTGWTPKVGPVLEDVTYKATYSQKDKDASIPGLKPVLSSDNKTIQYGYYPSTHVKDSSLISILEDLDQVNQYGYKFYNDEYYVKVESDVYNNESYNFNDGGQITNHEQYWFKCEPISWDVISVSEGVYTLISSELLDSHEFNDTFEVRDDINPNNYKESSVREYLSNEFYSLAFLYNDSHILDTDVDNSGPTTDDNENIFACENTTDKIYLISYQEALNLENKTAKTTDYARALGAWNSKDNSYLHNGAYWTRSPSSVFNYASWNVNSAGHLSEYSVDTLSFSIRPCIRISL